MAQTAMFEAKKLAAEDQIPYTEAQHYLRRERARMSASEKDFFISYTDADRRWAEWIAWCLEQEGCGVIIQAWDFAPSSNFVYEMDKALKEAQWVTDVLSPVYRSSILPLPLLLTCERACQCTRNAAFTY